jgi:hypothetical protein
MGLALILLGALLTAFPVWSCRQQLMVAGIDIGILLLG